MNDPFRLFYSQDEPEVEDWHFDDRRQAGSAAAWLLVAWIAFLVVLATKLIEWLK